MQEERKTSSVSILNKSVEIQYLEMIINLANIIDFAMKPTEKGPPEESLNKVLSLSITDLIGFIINPLNLQQIVGSFYGAREKTTDVKLITTTLNHGLPIVIKNSLVLFVAIDIKQLTEDLEKAMRFEVITKANPLQINRPQAVKEDTYKLEKLEAIMEDYKLTFQTQSCYTPPISIERPCYTTSTRNELRISENTDSQLHNIHALLSRNTDTFKTLLKLAIILNQAINSLEPLDSSLKSIITVELQKKTLPILKQ